MSEIPANPPSETASKPQIEIVHYPNSDIVINNDADQAAGARQLAELFKDGYPAAWEPIALDEVEMAHGVVDGVDFLVKPKIWSDKGVYDQQREVKMAFATTEQERRGILRSIQLLNGVVSEIGMAPKIKRIIAGPEAQEMARGWGFKSFSLVEPVIGVIYKASGQKSLVYEYIKGAKTLSDQTVKDRFGISDEKGIEMIESLSRLFAGQGIEAADLASRQLISDSEGNLYLTDIELYQPLKPSEPTTSL